MAVQIKISNINELIERLDSSKNETYYSDYYLIKVTFELSNIQNESFYSVGDAVSSVLSQYNIELLKVIHKNIVECREGEYNFSFTSLEPELPSRNISIIFNFNKIRFIIIGCEPIKGLDGDVKYFFDWNKCRNFDRNKEVIDLYEVCKLPQIKQNDIIAKIFEPVKGCPGVDVYGERIPAKSVSEINVKFADTYFERYFYSEKNRFVVDVRSEKNGVLLCEFRKKRFSETISRVYIWSKITLKDTEINKYFFNTKPLKLYCAPEIKIQGNLEGNIIIDFEDNLMVNGTIDCLEINARKNLKANIVRNTKINGNKIIDINTVNNSEINSNQAIRIYKNLLNSMIRSNLVMVKSKLASYILCTNSDIYANQLVMKGISIRNKLIIELGCDLFNKINKLDAEVAKIEKEINDIFSEIRTKVDSLFEKIKNFSFIKTESGLRILDELHLILNNILREKISYEIKEDMTSWIHKNSLDFYNIAKSCMSLLSHMERHIGLRSQKEDLNKSLSLLSDELKDIRAVIEGEVTGNGILIIKCNKETIKRENIGKLNLSLVYDIHRKQLLSSN